MHNCLGSPAARIRQPVSVCVMSVQDVVRWCCRTGYVSVNSRDNAGYTPLHGSCIRGHLHIARCLIEYGADVNAASRLDGARSAACCPLSRGSKVICSDDCIT